ncbi:MAG: F0F1 ATP synthase subunit alpha [Clostridia bacterium]|nr:F0F1 ATP synthase subunit alpha [Clostridia bacterium]
MCATQFSEEELAQIEEKLDGIAGRKLTYQVTVDPSLIGGFKAIVDNTVYDLSDRGYLDRIQSYVEESDKIVSAGQVADLFGSLGSDAAGEIREPAFLPTIEKRVSEFDGPAMDITRIGMVDRTADGVVYVRGLSGCRYGELLQFEQGHYGIVMNLDIERVGAVLLTGVNVVREDSLVRHTGHVVRVPVGEALLGRVVNPLGTPIDGRGSLLTDLYRPIEEAAPPIIDRGPIDTPLQTGIMAIDAMIPIGRGQRELIIGDRQTGKSAIALDTILNQKGKDVYCVYVAIGQKASSIAGLVDRMREFGALDYTVVVASTAADTAPMQYIAPYAGCSIAEHFMYEGKDVLIVYDDLSKHAVAYRTMSLLLRRPPGREAFPGDVFYLHSRLLERAAKLSAELGGGSMTALPIVETMDGDISSYIPTNVISITDGQIYLESELFNAGQRPAINVGLSVSRVGGSAQIKAMRQVAGPLRLDLAQYRELAVFSQFASDLDKSTQDALKQGERLMQTLIQPQFEPYNVEDEVILLYMATHNILMDIKTSEVRRFNREFLEYMRVQHPQIGAAILETGQLTEQQQQEILDAAETFKKQFVVASPDAQKVSFSTGTGGDSPLLPDEAEVVPVPEAGAVPEYVPADTPKK